MKKVNNTKYWQEGKKIKMSNFKMYIFFDPASEYLP